MATIECRSYKLTIMNQRPTAGTYIDFVSYDDVGGRGTQNGAIQTNGPYDNEDLVVDLLKALAEAWPHEVIKFQTDGQGTITGVA